MKPVHAILFVAAFLVSGCDILHVKQYCIAGVAPKSADSTRLKSVLQSVADQSGLRERTPDPDTTNVLFYARDDYEWGVTILEAGFYGDDVYLVLNGGFGTPPAYRKARRLLSATLEAEFGSRFSVSERRVQSQ